MGRSLMGAMQEQARAMDRDRRSNENSRALVQGLIGEHTEEYRNDAEFHAAVGMFAGLLPRMMDLLAEETRVRQDRQVEAIRQRYLTPSDFSGSLDR